MSQIIFCITIYISLAAVFFIGCKNTNSSSSDDMFIRLNSLRGLFALEIVIGHCVRYESCPLTPLGNFMLISVGYFFFISGFGLARSYHTKPNYLNSFITHRILHLIYIAAIALVVTTIIAYISPVKTDFRNLPESFTTLVLSIRVRTNWYIRELLILYILFYLCYLLVKQKKKTILCIAIFIVCICLFFLEYKLSFGYTRCWFASIICFPMGIIVYDNYDRIISALSTILGKILSILVLILGLVFSLIDYPSIIGYQFSTTEMIYALFNNILCIGFIAILSILLLYKHPGNAILAFFTRISTEIYVFQFVFISIAEKMKLLYTSKIVFVLLLDISISYLSHICFIMWKTLKK